MNSKHYVTVPGIVLEHALDDYENRWSEQDVLLARACGFGKHPIFDDEDYDFDLASPSQREFLWVVLGEAEARIDAIVSMMGIDGGEDYHPGELRVLVPFVKRMTRTLSLCEREVTR